MNIMSIEILLILSATRWVNPVLSRDQHSVSVISDRRPNGMAVFLHSCFFLTIIIVVRSFLFAEGGGTIYLNV